MVLGGILLLFHMQGSKSMARIRYELKDLDGTQAIAIIKQIVNSLDGIEPEDLTTAEKKILWQCVKNPPKINSRGAELKILGEK